MPSTSKPSSMLLSYLGKRSVAEHKDGPCFRPCMSRKGSHSLDFRCGNSCPGFDSKAETTSTLAEIESSGSACRYKNTTNYYETQAVTTGSTNRIRKQTRPLHLIPLTQPPDRFCLVNHCHSDQHLANCDSKSSYAELVTLFLVAKAAGAVIVTTQPKRLDWMSRIDDDLLVARMQMLNRRGRKCDGGKKLESAM